MNEYKVDLNNYTENQPIPRTDEQYRNAFQSLVIEYHKMKTERDTCLEDIDKLRKALIKTQNLADELMEYQVKYINLTDHIRMKAETNSGVSRYIDLVNYIDRLERAGDER